MLQSKEEDKVQEWIQSYATPDPGHHIFLSDISPHQSNSAVNTWVITGTAKILSNRTPVVIDAAFGIMSPPFRVGRHIVFPRASVCLSVCPSVCPSVCLSQIVSAL